MGWFERDRRKRVRDISKTVSGTALTSVPLLDGDEDAATPVEVSELGKLARLNPFSPIAVSVLQLFDRDGVSTQEIARLLQSDPALAAETLAYVNSPLFAVPEPIAEIHNAVLVLGADKVKRLAATLAMRGMLRSAPKISVTRRLWRHSIATGLIAAELAPLYQVDPDLASTAGILHDIGRVGLLAKDGDEFAQIVLQLHENVDEILAAERQACGMDHCVAGAYLCRTWGLPAAFQEAASRHHEAGAHTGVAAVIQLACAMADDMTFAGISHRAVMTVAERIAAGIPAAMREKGIALGADFEKRVARKVEEFDF
ncbi:MAG TPA: HDOD domain-containing protein [Bryobacteraceae bacterium]|jgi:putative nucleotidyltransferase with HDIG domain|nr:HDOD domain-containing protein [Bryobacteraceae bacterium]